MRMHGPLLSLLCLCALAGCNRTSGFLHNDLGQRAFKKGNHAEAARHFRMAAADSPQNANYAHNLGVAMLTHLGGRSKAVASASWTALRRAAPGRRRGAQAAVALHAALDSAVGACVASAARLSIYLPIQAYLPGA